MSGGFYHRPPARHVGFGQGYPVRNRRKRRPGRPRTLDKRAWELLALLRTSEGAAAAALRRDMHLTEDQFFRVVRRARRIVEPLGGEIVVERRVVDVRNGGPSWSYSYRVTMSVSEIMRALGDPE